MAKRRFCDATNPHNGSVFYGVKQGSIYIHGLIGSFLDPETKQETHGVDLLNVISQVKSQPDALSFLVKVGSPGGLVDTGNQIYDYLMSLKQKGIKINTITDSYISPEGEIKQGVGSIATKIFLAGDERSIVDGHEFFIHNPWNQPEAGDSNHQAVELASLRQTEAELRNFYQTHTKITDVGLKGLMDNETGMNADQAVTLGFATKKVKTSKVQAFAFKQNTMSKEKTLGQKIGDILDMALGNKPVASFTPAKQAAAAPVSLDLPLEDGTSITTDATDPANLMGSNITIMDSTGASVPAPDGDYELADGTIVTVVGGVVTAVGQEAVPAPGATPAPNAPPAPNAQAQEIAALKAELAQLKAAQPVDVQAQINAAIDNLKASMVAGKRPNAAINNFGEKATKKQRSINDVMASKREERKNQINKN